MEFFFFCLRTCPGTRPFQKRTTRSTNPKGTSTWSRAAAAAAAALSPAPNPPSLALWSWKRKICIENSPPTREGTPLDPNNSHPPLCLFFSTPHPVSVYPAKRSATSDAMIRDLFLVPMLPHVNKRTCLLASLPFLHSIHERTGPLLSGVQRGVCAARGKEEDNVSRDKKKRQPIL